MNSLVDDLGTRLGRKASKRSNEMAGKGQRLIVTHPIWQVELIYMVLYLPFFQLFVLELSSTELKLKSR